MTIDLLQLERMLNALAPEHQRSVFDYAQYLHQKYKLADSNIALEISDPIIIERPANETVVAAMKRLRRCYPMIDTDKILHEASDLLSTHLLKGQSAESVIDKLEILFKTHYDNISA
jgi:hypothetical protein